MLKAQTKKKRRKNYLCISLNGSQTFDLDDLKTTIKSCQNISTSIVDILLTVVMREDLTTILLDLQGIMRLKIFISQIDLRSGTLTYN